MIQNNQTVLSVAYTKSNSKIGKRQRHNLPQRKKQRNTQPDSSANVTQTGQPVFTLGRRQIYNNDLQAALFAFALINTILIIYNFIQITKK